MQLSDMNLTPEQLENAAKLAGFNLMVPANAEAGRKKGVARWMENVVIEDAYREDEIGGNGEQRVVFHLVTKVLPNGQSDDNVGRVFTTFLRANFGVLQGRTNTVGAGDEKNEKIMSSMTIKKLRQLTVALGLSLDAGLTPEIIDGLFPEPYNSEKGVARGAKLVVQMKDDSVRTNPRGENNQEIEALVAGEGL